jgi:AmmeMemoRadiSam system protein A
VGQQLLMLDSRVIEAAGSLDHTLFLDTLHELGSTVCGREPIALLLETLGFMTGEDVFQRTLDYQTSGDLTGDFEHTVSYGSLGYFRADSFRIDEEAQRALLTSARATLQRLSATGERKAIPPVAANPALARHAAVFVSLHRGRELFGCVGTVTAAEPLAEAVPNLTLEAALDDPRFPRRASVPDELSIEISVLTPMKQIRDWRSFQIGRHGAYLELGERSALLLPQVASHGAFTQSSFLEALSRKACAGPGAYRDPRARLSVFLAQVIG